MSNVNETVYGDNTRIKRIISRLSMMTKPKLKVSTFIPKKLNAERFHLFEKKQLVDSRSTESLNTATEKSFTQVVTNTQVDEINIALKNVTPLNSSMSSVRSDLKVSPPNTPFTELSSRTVNDVVKANSVVSLEKALIPVAITAASQLPTIELDQLETNAQAADIKDLLDESSANCGLVDTNKFQELKNYVLPEIAVTPLDLPMILIAPVSTALNAPAVKAGQITPEVEYSVSTPNVDELLVPESVSLSYPSVVPTATVENYWQNVKIDVLSTQLVKHDPVRTMLNNLPEPDIVEDKISIVTPATLTALEPSTPCALVTDKVSLLKKIKNAYGSIKYTAWYRYLHDFRLKQSLLKAVLRYIGGFSDEECGALMEQLDLKISEVEYLNDRLSEYYSEYPPLNADVTYRYSSDAPIDLSPYISEYEALDTSYLCYSDFSSYTEHSRPPSSSSETY